MTDDPTRLTGDVKRHLDLGVEHLDDGTALRLRQARASALTGGQSRGALRPSVTATATAFASVAALGIGVWLYQPVVFHERSPLEDLELLATVEDPLVYEDLDFYYWLETQDDQS